MSEENNNNMNTDYNSDETSSANVAEQSADSEQGSDYQPQYNTSQQGYDQNGSNNNGQPYYEQQPNYNNGQYGSYNQNAGQQYYGQYQNYGQNGGYYNGQYQNYGQNGGYYNGQYQNYSQNGGYNNGQYQNYGQYNGPYSGYYNNQPYANPQAGYQQAEAIHPPVTNVFYYILMALTAVSTIVGIVFAINLISTTFSSINFDAAMSQDFNSLYSSMMGTFASGSSAAYTIFTYLLRFAILTFSIIDIVMVHKSGYPITGLILFTIFLKPGYFLWRAYVLKQKKTIPLLFTIAYVAAYFVYFIWCFSFMTRMMSSMAAGF